MKKSLIGLSQIELESIFETLAEKKYRARQLIQCLYTEKLEIIHKMHCFSLALRTKLAQKYCLHSIKLEESSQHGETIKYLFRLQDGHFVESVLINNNKRVTICISSQVGCAVNCLFCASGKMGFKRNLTVTEIVEQVLFLSKQNTNRISNIVFMGMGEPFLNYDNVISAANIFHSDSFFGISSKRITISTSGIIPRIYQFSDEKHPFRLAISLNNPDQLKREKLMPITKKYTVKSLIEAADYYTKKCKKKITFEYVMIKNYNIKKSDAKLIRSLTHSINCKINLIPCNSIDTQYSRPNSEEAERFKRWIEVAKPAFIRKTKGRAIEAACGMLHNKFMNQDTNILGAIS